MYNNYIFKKGEAGTAGKNLQILARNSTTIIATVYSDGTINYSGGRDLHKSDLKLITLTVKLFWPIYNSLS